MRINRRAAVFTAIVAAFALAQSSAAAAQAADRPVVVEFVAPASTTIEYGQYWDFPLTADYDFFYQLYNAGHVTVSTTGASAGYSPQLGMYATPGGVVGSLSAPYDVAPLSTGTYDFTVSGTFDDGVDTWHGETPAAARLVVQKAQLGIELRVTADPNNGDGAIVTARFTGRFVDEYQSSFFESAALSPAGEWQITLKDQDGVVAIERTIERAAGDDVLATSFYWNAAEPDKQYSATAEFTPSGASAGNFTVASATTFSYTAPASQRPVPSSTATAKPTAGLPESPGFAMPLWSIIVIVVLILGLGALVTILSVRLHKRPIPASAGAVES